MAVRYIRYSYLYVVFHLNMIPFMESSSQPSPFQKIGRTVQTLYGTLRGLRREFPENYYLRPIEAYFGLQYGVLRGDKLRLMPPKSPIERFDFIKKFVEYEPVCPQRKLGRENEIHEIVPHLALSHIRRIIDNTTSQAEDCLRLNLYVPIQDQPEKLYWERMLKHGESISDTLSNGDECGSLPSTHK